MGLEKTKEVAQQKNKTENVSEKQGNKIVNMNKESIDLLIVS
jgi:hypothetical protein